MTCCQHCLQSERDCDCALELDYALVLQALGIDQPATLFDVAQADRMDAQYKLAVTMRAVGLGLYAHLITTVRLELAKLGSS